MNFPNKYYRWKDTSEFSVHYSKWDEWKPLNLPGETTEEDILYWISKGLPYQICEIEIKNVIGYEAEETSAVTEVTELLEMLYRAIKVLERVGNDTLDGRNTVQDARNLISKVEETK